LLSLVICTSANKLEAEVNRERHPRFPAVYISSLTAADQYLKPLCTFRSPHQDSLGQEGRAGSVGSYCTKPHAYGGGTIELAKSCAMVLLQRLLRSKNRIFDFDTQNPDCPLDIMWIEKKAEPFTERLPYHLAMERGTFQKPEHFHF